MNCTDADAVIADHSGIRLTKTTGRARVAGLESGIPDQSSSGQSKKQPSPCGGAGLSGSSPALLWINMLSFPKEKNYRNQKLRDLAREAEYCCSCKKPNDGTVVAAHSNAQKHGKGLGVKAHDVVCYVCKDCHDLLDGRTGGLTRAEAYLMFLEAVYETVLWLLRTGRMVVK